MSSNTAPRKFRRIATEEAFSIPEIADGLREVARSPGNSLDLLLVKQIYDAASDTPRARLRSLLLDLEQQRLRDMDDNGVDMQLLLLTAPGVQMFDADTATGARRGQRDVGDRLSVPALGTRRRLRGFSADL